MSGRLINDGMGEFVANQVLTMLARKKIHVVGSNVLILGLAFKENCPDVRNTRVVDIISELEDFDAVVDVYDPWVNAEQACEEYGIKMVERPGIGSYDAIILAVAHEEFLVADSVKRYGKANHVLYDIKSVLAPDEVDGRL